MLTSTQVFAIVNRIVSEKRLSPSQAARLRLWASRWLSTFTSGREYTYRGVKTLTGNAAGVVDELPAK